MRVAVAGTLGPIHDGHRALFEAALERGDEGVVVGLTTDQFAIESRSDDPRPVPPFAERRAALREEFATLDEWGRDVEVRAIDDEVGFAASDPTLDAIVVSGETDHEVADINQIRQSRGLDPLEPVVVPVVAAEDGGRISSTRIVRGEIDEHGHLLADDDGGSA